MGGKGYNLLASTHNEAVITTVANANRSPTCKFSAFLQSKTTHTIHVKAYEGHQNMSPDLSWCHCRSWPCCQLTTPGHRVRKSRAKGLSEASVALFRCCRAACACRSPVHPLWQAEDCASSSAVLLFKDTHSIINEQRCFCSCVRRQRCYTVCIHTTLE